MRNDRDPRLENPVVGHAEKQRVNLFGTNQPITRSGQVGPRLKAKYITAPESFTDRQIPLAPRASFIHDPMYGLAERGKTFSSTYPPMHSQQ